MRPFSHFGSFVAALAAGLALAVAGGVSYLASAPTIPAQDVIKPPVRAHTTASTLSAWRVPDFGNPDGHAFVPPAGRAVDTSHPDQVIGRGTPAGCTSAAVVRAVARGGVITFNCGPRPLTITMTATAKVVNTRHRIVLDGRGLITLSGVGRRQILYMNTCDKRQILTTSDCFDQQWPQLIVQNMTFSGGYSAVRENPNAN